MALVKTMRKALDTAADWSGATSAVKVGGNLVQNVKRTIQGKPRKNLYSAKDTVHTLVGDAAGIVGLGTAALAGVSGLAAKGAAKAVPAAAKAKAVPDGVSAARKALMTDEAKAGHAWKAFQKVSSAGAAPAKAAAKTVKAANPGKLIQVSKEFVNGKWQHVGFYEKAGRVIVKPLAKAVSKASSFVGAGLAGRRLQSSNGVTYLKK
jgi:hypothetical protein